MIPVVTVRNFGELLRSRREYSHDESTGRPFTQQRIADEVSRLVGETISRSLVASWEGGAEPQIKHVNAMIKMRLFSGIEAAEALGIDVESAPLTEMEQDLLAAFRRLRSSPILQAGALRVVQALPVPQSDQSRDVPRRRRRSAE